jgi:hypothetical protein
MESRREAEGSHRQLRIEKPKDERVLSCCRILWKRLVFVPSGLVPSLGNCDVLGRYQMGRSRSRPMQTAAEYCYRHVLIKNFMLP